MNLKKIKFFNKIMGGFLQLLPLLVSILLFIVLKLIISKLNIDIASLGLSNSDKISFFIDIGIFVLSISPIFFKHFKKFFRNLKIFCYKCLLNYYYKTSSILIATSINKLINIFFKYNRIELQYQNNTAQLMIDLLKDDNESSKIVFIVGEAYSGKTTSILLFLEQLITNYNNRDIFDKMEKNIYYCDFNVSTNTTKLFDEYNLNKYNKSLLIVDNIHRESESTFIQLLEQIIAASNRAFAVFAIMRKPEEFINNVHSIDSIYKLLSESHKIELSQNDMSMSSKHILNARIDQNEYLTFCKRLYFSEEEFARCNVLYIHVYKMFCIYKKYGHQFILDFFETLYKNTIDKKELVIFIGIILLCQFTGTFDIKDLFEVCCNIPKKIVNKFVNNLLQVGFLEKGLYDIKNKQYILHESLSNYYLFRLAIFKEDFNTIKLVSVKLHKIYRSKNLAISWYYSIICRDLLDNSYDEILFDKTLNSSNQKLMLSILQNYKVFIKTQQLSLIREEAVLNAIGGDEYIAKKLYLEHFHISKNPKVLLELFEVKHKYYREYSHELKMFSNIKDPYINLGISYWKKHINMHYGKFNFYDYANDADLIKTSINVILNSEPYEVDIPALGNRLSGQVEITCPDNGNHSDSEFIRIGIYPSHIPLS